MRLAARRPTDEERLAAHAAQLRRRARVVERSELDADASTQHVDMFVGLRGAEPETAEAATGAGRKQRLAKLIDFVYAAYGGAVVEAIVRRANVECQQRAVLKLAMSIDTSSSMNLSAVSLTRDAVADYDDADTAFDGPTHDALGRRSGTLQRRRLRYSPVPSAKAVQTLQGVMESVLAKVLGSIGFNAAHGDQHGESFAFDTERVVEYLWVTHGYEEAETRRLLEEDPIALMMKLSYDGFPLSMGGATAVHLCDGDRRLAQVYASPAAWKHVHTIGLRFGGESTVAFSKLLAGTEEVAARISRTGINRTRARKLLTMLDDCLGRLERGESLDGVEDIWASHVESSEDLRAPLTFICVADMGGEFKAHGGGPAGSTIAFCPKCLSSCHQRALGQPGGCETCFRAAENAAVAAGDAPADATTAMVDAMLPLHRRVHRRAPRPPRCTEGARGQHPRGLGAPARPRPRPRPYRSGELRCPEGRDDEADGG